MTKKEFALIIAKKIEEIEKRKKIASNTIKIYSNDDSNPEVVKAKSQLEMIDKEIEEMNKVLYYPILKRIELMNEEDLKEYKEEKIEEIEEEISEIEKQIEDLENETEKLEAQNKNLIENFDEKENNLEEIKKEVNLNTQKIKDNKRTLTDLKDKQENKKTEQDKIKQGTKEMLKTKLIEKLELMGAEYELREISAGISELKKEQENLAAILIKNPDLLDFIRNKSNEYQTIKNERIEEKAVIPSKIQQVKKIEQEIIHFSKYKYEPELVPKTDFDQEMLSKMKYSGYVTIPETEHKQKQIMETSENMINYLIENKEIYTKIIEDVKLITNNVNVNRNYLPLLKTYEQLLKKYDSNYYQNQKNSIEELKKSIETFNTKKEKFYKKLFKTKNKKEEIESEEKRIKERLDYLGKYITTKIKDSIEINLSVMGLNYEYSSQINNKISSGYAPITEDNYEMVLNLIIKLDTKIESIYDETIKEANDFAQNIKEAIEKLKQRCEDRKRRLENVNKEVEDRLNITRGEIGETYNKEGKVGIEDTINAMNLLDRNKENSEKNKLLAKAERREATREVDDELENLNENINIEDLEEMKKMIMSYIQQGEDPKTLK